MVSRRRRDHTRILHLDMFLCVFDHLAQPDVLAAAGTCTRWRTIARSHPKFYYHIVLRFDMSRPRFEQSLVEFCTMLERSEKERLRMSVQVFHDHTSSTLARDPQDFDLATPRAVSQMRLMTSIAAALPFLVKLDLVYGTDSVHPLSLQHFYLPLLRRPAPQLREFYFTFVPSNSDQIVTVQQDIFAGDAPMLELMRLGGLRLDQKRVPAFRTVRTVGLALFTPCPDLAVLFPSVRDLTVSIVESSEVSLLDTLLPQLHELSIFIPKGSPQLCKELGSYSKVARTTVHVDMDGGSEVSLAPFVSSLPPVPLAIDLLLTASNKDIHIAFEAVDGQLTRNFYLLRPPPSTSLVLVLTKELGAVPTRLISRLHVHENFFNGLAFYLRSLPTLRTLRMSWPHGKRLRETPYFALMDPAYAGVECPRLETFELVDPARRAEISARKLSLIRPGRRRVTIRFDGVRLLGRLEQHGNRFVPTTSTEDDAKMRADERMYVPPEKFKENMDQCPVQ